MNNTMTRWLLASALLLTSMGCMGSPTHGQWFNNREDTIPFSGLVPTPGEMINIEVYSRALDGQPESWDFLASAQADSTPTYTEPDGRKWYAWSVNTKLHFNNRTKGFRWKLIGTGKYEAKVRAFSWTNGYLSTMHSSLMQCLQGNSLLMCGGPPVQTGQEAVDQCGTGRTEASIYAVD